MSVDMSSGVCIMVDPPVKDMAPVDQSAVNNPRLWSRYQCAIFMT
jgi:hypothetical protein